MTEFRLIWSIYISLWKFIIGMKYIDRQITTRFLAQLNRNKVIVLLGSRRVGKTVFIEHIIQNHIRKDYLYLNGDDVQTQAAFADRTLNNFKRLIGKNRYLIIDEAQNIKDIGWALKLIHDQIKEVTIIATGSSTFDLQSKIGEPLTGRKSKFFLFPFSQQELSAYENLIETKANLSARLIYGSYPEIFQNDDKISWEEYLKDLSSEYLFKDILVLENIHNAAKLHDLLRLLAFQVGNLVSYDELGRQLGMSKNTVIKYLDLLTKTFIIFPLPGYSRNLRNEITKSKKWYFYDNGIRNAMIYNFNPLEFRNDIGQLWENYFISERIKYQYNNRILANNYFWRTYKQQEIDLIEESGRQLTAFETKWGSSKKHKIPKSWSEAYPDSRFYFVNPDNYLDFIDPL